MTSTLATVAALLFGGAVQPLAQAQARDPAPVAAAHPHAQATVRYSEPMRRLLDAAQEFRAASQALAKEAPGPRRNDAIKATNQALRETQAAMMATPPSERSGGIPRAGYPTAMQRLQEAAEDLQQTLQDLEDKPATEQRERAIERADEALFQAQQALADLPPRVAGR